MSNCLVLLMISILFIIVHLVSDSFEIPYENLFGSSYIEWIDVGSDTLYSIDRSVVTWPEAVEKCKIRGKNGRLATLDSETSLISLKRNAKDLMGHFWIGIHEGSSGAFQRIGGIQSDFFNWAPGEPNNPSKEQCVELIMTTIEFNNVPCNIKMTYICVSDKENKTNSVSSTSASSLIGTDSTDWIDIGTNTLYSIEFKLATWNEAVEKCKLKGKNGRLASIDSIQESNLLRPHIWKTEMELWIGIRKGPSGAFVRNGPAQSTFFNWDLNQPDNNLLPGEDCVELFYSNMKWNDALCDSKRFYLCASDKDPSFSTISSIPRTNSSVSGNSMFEPLITLTDVAKETHAIVIATSFLFVFAFLILVAVIALKRRALTPKVLASDTQSLL